MAKWQVEPYNKLVVAFCHMDKYLLCSFISLLIIGVVMVASASTFVASKYYHNQFHFFLRQLIYVITGCIAFVVFFTMPIKTWQRISKIMLLVAILLLGLVLIPGIGHQINGSRRWLGVASLHLQVSEYVKFAIVVYLSGYLVRHQQEVENQFSGFLKPLLILVVIACLLLLQPDFGSIVVIGLTMFAMIYLAGAKVWQFILLLAMVLIVFFLLAISSPYRLQRLVNFLHPFAHQYHGGYQLVQSLIAFGRGGLFGVGLGGSVEKLFYLPESYTDFLFAIIAEELGLIGIGVILCLYAICLARGLLIGWAAKKRGFDYGAYMAYGFSIWLALQATINMGVNVGLLPTKGLTLPLMSYGGSSMIISCVAIAILLRIDYESKIH